MLLAAVACVLISGTIPTALGMSTHAYATYCGPRNIGVRSWSTWQGGNLHIPASSAFELTYHFVVSPIELWSSGRFSCFY